MALTLTSNSVTLDESLGLQTSGVVTATEDNNDSDVLLALLPAAFTTRLFTGLGLSNAFATANGAAMNTLVTPDAGATLAFAKDSTGAGFDEYQAGVTDPTTGVDSGLQTLDGEKIYLFQDQESGLGDDMLLGVDANGSIIFAAYLSATGAVSLIQFEALNNDTAGGPSVANHDDFLDLDGKVFISQQTETDFNLAGAPSGQNLFLMFTQANPTVDASGRITNPTIIATGKDPANQSTGVNITTGDTINTSQAGGPTTFGTNNQMITEQEGIRFTFVTGARADVTIPNLDQNEADLESNIDFTGLFGARSATFDVVQLQSGKSAQVKITAINNTEAASAISGNNFIDSYANDGSQTVNIAASSIKVFSGTTDVTSLVTITEIGDSVLITGVKAGYSITYATATDHNRVLIENGAALNAKGNTHADFDIGGFTLLEVATDTVQVGDKIRFEDDGPSITMGTVGTPDTLEVDETNLLGDATANFADNFSNTSDFGTDGAGNVASAYALNVSSAGVDSGLDDTATGNSVLLFKEGSQIVGREGTNAADAETGDIVFIVSVSAAGVVTLDQKRAVVHPNVNDPNDSKTLAAADLITLTRTDTITDKDGDTDEDDATINIGQALNFRDDGPTAGTLTGILLDDDALQFGNPGGTGDDADSANVNGVLPHSFGADGAGTVAYLATGAPGGFTYELSGTSLLIKQGTTTVLTLTINAATGAYTVTQNNPIQHPAGLNENNQSFTVNYRVTDRDGDKADGTVTIDVDDDTPIVTVAPADLEIENTGPSPSGTAAFDYSIGADFRTTFSSSNSDFSAITLTGTVGTNNISNASVTWSSESASTAVFNVSFQYQADPGSSDLSTATGTLTFTKDAADGLDNNNGTYTFQLNAPIQGFTILTTGNALGFTGYTVNTATVDKTQPDVSVAQLSDNFWVQFSGVSEPGAGTGTSNLQALAPNVALGGANGDAFVNGEVFKQTATWVSVSQTANGVAGDTLQKGEVLDMDFFLDNPFGFVNATPDTQATGIFLKFDGIGSEDLVVVLKLVDTKGTASTADDERTTKAIIIDNADILKFGSVIPAPYNNNIVLDNNDGAVIIESNDFNVDAGKNWLIEGAQLLVSTEGITGTGINLNGATGSGGGSTGTQNFGTDTTDNDVIKISDIGFLSANTGTLETSLDFSFYLQDTDSDQTTTQTIHVDIVPEV
jgi:hypothetical protein